MSPGSLISYTNCSCVSWLLESLKSESSNATLFWTDRGSKSGRVTSKIFPAFLASCQRSGGKVLVPPSSGRTDKPCGMAV